MKNLYRKGTVHPSPPLKADHLSFLPATILTLAAVLSPGDREVLAYLISSSSSSNFSGNRRKNSIATSNNKSSSISVGLDHPPSFNCYCFGCYMSYWVRWDSSPNRQLIHEIIDAYEDGLSMQSRKEKSSRKDRRKISKGSSVVVGSDELKQSELTTPNNNNMEFSESSENSMEEVIGARGGGAGDDGREEEEEEEMGKGSLRRFMSFLGEKFWGVWT